MPKVPTLNSDIPSRATPAFQPEQPLRPPAGAFGGDSGQAQQNLGQSMQRTGDVVMDQIIKHQEREDEQRDLELQDHAQQQIQSMLVNQEVDENGVPKGYLSRQLNHAKGATLDFDSQAEEIKKSYLDAVTGQNQKKRMALIIGNHLTNAREQVIRHEAQESEKAFQNALESNLKTTISNAAGLVDGESVQRAIESLKAQSSEGYRHLGIDPAGPVAAGKNMDLSAKLVESAITPLLENDPKAAQKVLDANKDQITPLDAVKIQATIDGKIIHDQQASAWDAVKGNRLADGNINMAFAEKYVTSLKLPQDRKDQILSYVHTRASIANSELKQQQEATKRSYTDQLVSDYTKVPIEVAFARAAKTGLPPTMIAELQNEATSLYQNPSLRFETWLSKQPEATVGAVEASRQAIEGAYPTTKMGVVSDSKVNLRKAAMTELEQQWIGKSPSQIRQITADSLKSVETGQRWYWFNPTETSWRLSAENRASEDLRVGQLEKQFPEAFAKAKAKVVKDGAPLVYDNLKAVMDKMTKGKE
jgi:hypothetical protein